MKNLKQLTKEEYKKLDKAGMLYVLYPEATGDYPSDIVVAKDKHDNYFAGNMDNFNNPSKPTYKVGDWVYTGYNLLKIGRITYMDIPWIEVRDAMGNGTNVHIKKIRKATPSEIESHLIEEAKRRGYKKGTKICCAEFNTLKATIISNDFAYDADNDDLYVETDDINTSYYSVYKKGKWAEILKDESIKIGGYDVEFGNTHIKVGCKVFDKTDLSAIRHLSNMSKDNKWRMRFDNSGHIYVEYYNGTFYHVSKTDVDDITDKALS